MTDIGLSCAKEYYSRSHGHPLRCAEGTEQSGALCYPECTHGAEGHGPVCWGSCPAGTFECGALCLAEGESCSDMHIAGLVKSAFHDANFEAETMGNGQSVNISRLVQDHHVHYDFDNCAAW